MPSYDMRRLASLNEIRDDSESWGCSCMFTNQGLLELAAGLLGVFVLVLWLGIDVSPIGEYQFLGVRFVLAEFAGAYYSGSLGLLGDASAMYVLHLVFDADVSLSFCVGLWMYSHIWVICWPRVLRAPITLRPQVDANCSRKYWRRHLP
jgi:hypothetical protein